MATAWTIEELVEDALAAYLRARAPIPESVYVAFEKTDEETVRPCVVVSAATTDLVTPDIQRASRAVNVTVSVLTEACAELVDGRVVKTARARNAEARAWVVNALNRADLLATLATDEYCAPELRLSKAILRNTERAENGRDIVTGMNVYIIANTVEV
jgi:hypothetical protein